MMDLEAAMAMRRYERRHGRLVSRRLIDEVLALQRETMARATG